MKSRTIAIVIPYTDKQKILLQKRTSIKKWGEEWSFWGGSIEEGETKEDAARRELKEELDMDIKELHYLGKITQTLKKCKPPYEEWEITYEIFVTKIIEDKFQFNVKEGDGLDFFEIEEARKLVMAPKIDKKALDIVQKFLNESLGHALL